MVTLPGEARVMFISTVSMITVTVFRFDVPDRLSGFACLQELNPKRTWNFIMVTSVHICLGIFHACTHLLM